MDKALEPQDYCATWIPKNYNVTPDQRGYKKLCIKELARLTGYEESYIRNWGKDFEKAPEIARRLCAMASILNNFSIDWSTFMDKL